MKTAETRHYPCCFSLESNPGFPCRDFCATGKFYFDFVASPERSELDGAEKHRTWEQNGTFFQFVDCQYVGADYGTWQARNKGEFCSSGWNTGTKRDYGNSL